MAVGVTAGVTKQVHAWEDEAQQMIGVPSP